MDNLNGVCCSLGAFDGLFLYEGRLESTYTKKLLTDQSLSAINVLILQHFTIPDCLLSSSVRMVSCTVIHDID